VTSTLSTVAGPAPEIALRSSLSEERPDRQSSPPPRAVRPRTKDRTLAKRINTAASILSIPLFLMVWELISLSGMVNDILFPPPTTVALALRDWIASGDFTADLAASFARVITGFTIGALSGIVMGILTGRVAFFASLFGPIFQVLRPIPPIAFVSVVILWFGVAESGKIFLIVWGVFFMVWLSTHLGVQKVDPGLIRAAQMLGTPPFRLLTEIIFLGALPYIVVGLRSAVGISFYTLVAAELAGAFSGVFYRISLAQQNMQTGQVLGGLVVLGFISFLADRAFAVLSARVVWWR
jgi:ABC-type nitrate/sulfonate/bicarbonate transport system permease component